MTTIRYADLVESVAGALQYISYYHPADYPDKVLLWQTVIHVTFLLSALAIAYTDRLLTVSQKADH